MEIHAPHKPILSLREALVHLTIVTVGILIALSLDGVRQWVEHRSLATEARENIARELRDNAKELDGFLKSIPKMDTDLEHARDVLAKIVPGKELKDESVNFGFNIAQLSTASRTTAEITGAFSYMGYEEVKKYAGVYDLQAKFVKLQEDTLGMYTAALSRVTVFSEASKATPGDIDSVGRVLDTWRASLYAQNQIGGELSKAYKKIAAEEH